MIIKKYRPINKNNLFFSIFLISCLLCSFMLSRNILYLQQQQELLATRNCKSENVDNFIERVRNEKEKNEINNDIPNRVTDLMNVGKEYMFDDNLYFKTLHSFHNILLYFAFLFIIHYLLLFFFNISRRRYFVNITMNPVLEMIHYIHRMDDYR